MQHVELELAVGDVVRIGDKVLTVLELDGDEVLFRLCDRDSDPAFASDIAYDRRPR